MHSRPSTPSDKGQQLFKKLLLSGFVVFSFLAYAIHKPLTDPGNQLGQVPPGTGGQATQLLPGSSSTQTSPTGSPSQAATASATGPNPTSSPQSAAVPTTTTQGQYKDGTYTGPSVDAFYGTVQVQTTIQGGKIASVTFLNYPHDRQTSAYINSIAMPDLQQEVIQAQSANVDIISGATLTSEAFIQSLQTALSQAKG